LAFTSDNSVMISSKFYYVYRKVVE